MTGSRNEPSPSRSVRARLRTFLRTESSGAVLLLVGAATALVWANSPWSDSYGSLWKDPRNVGIGAWTLTTDLRHVVADGLMTLFFLVVGLEIKREVLEGELRERRAAILPVAGAIGGMVVPALLYLAVAGDTAARGWAIPMATDIAFALGVLALATRSALPSLTTFLLALAIVDDIGAIAVIALFYSEGIALPALGVAAAIAVAIAAATHLRARAGRWWWPIHLVLGLGLWIAVAASGVHPTIAGVALGLLTPTTPTDDAVPSPVETLERRLHPWTSYLIVPLFALASAGVRIPLGELGDLATHPVTVGVFLGLVVGKTFGISLAAALAVRARLARPLADVPARGLLGTASVAGIGFTVALFVTDLAFGDGPLGDRARLGILAASVVAGALGWGLTRGLGRYAPGGPGPAGHDTASVP